MVFQKSLLRHIFLLLKMYMTENGDLVSASIHFKVEKGERTLAMKGVDLLRMENKRSVAIL